MSRKVLMSFESKNRVAHRENCRYVKHILCKNLMTLTQNQAWERGYRPCKCCNSLDSIYKMEMSDINAYLRDKDMALDAVDHKLYARTPIGCWKIVYNRKYQTFILYHKNYVDGMLSINDVEKGAYHLQKDRKPSDTIVKLLRYIYEHDENKYAAVTDYKLLPHDSKRQKKYYSQAKKRQEKKSRRRVDMLFKLMESGIDNKSLLLV